MTVDRRARDLRESAPAVACFALRRRDVEPAPLAGLLAGLAGVLALIALLIGG